MRNTIQHCRNRPRLEAQLWVRRRGGLPSCTVGHDINVLYRQNIDENPCSQTCANGNNNNILMGISATYGYDSLISDQQFGRVRASNASRAVESFADFNRSSCSPSNRNRTFTQLGIRVSMSRFFMLKHRA